MSPICSWCGKGSGRRYTRSLNLTFYYVCHECVGDVFEDKNGYYKHMEGINNGID